MLRISQDAHTFDDLLLRPEYSDILPHQTNLQTKLVSGFNLNIPLLSAAMDTITEADLAIAMAQKGGIGVIHRNMPIEKQAQNVRKVKKFESAVIRRPITIAPDEPIYKLINLVNMYHISGVPVVDGEQVVGIVTNRDFRFETRTDLPVSSIMTPQAKLITVSPEDSKEEALRLLQENRLEKILLTDKGNYRLLGLITLKDIQKVKFYPNATRDNESRLRVAAAIGVGADTEGRVASLVDVGADALVIDTAHAHSKMVLERLEWLVKNYPDIPVIAGNIATKEAALALAKRGVAAVKVGIGPGSICTTRIISGIGIPQLTAIAEVAEALRDRDIPVIADGGIRYSGDIAKAIAAGADSVMIGSLFAGTDEAPGNTELYQGRAYKNYRGMGSMAALSEYTRDRYFQVNAGSEEMIPQGVEGRVPCRGPIGMIIDQLMGGLRASMGYTGCKDIPTMQTRPQFIRITQASLIESHVHDINVTKEAPNYHLF